EFQLMLEAPEAEWQKKWQDMQVRLAAGGAQSKQLLRLRVLDLVLDYAAEDPAKNLERAARLAHLLDDPINPRPAETHFLTMLQRDLPPQSPPSREYFELAQKALRLRGA